MSLPPRILKNVRRHNLPAWVVAFCCAAMASNALAQTNSTAPPVAAKPETAKEKTDRQASHNFILIPPHGEDWTRHFQMGAIMAFGINAKFHESGNFAVNHDSGTYDDGYVRTDDTGNAGGATSYWGYENASQYSAANQTISFHSVTSFNATGSAEANGDPSFGLDLAYGDDYIYYQPAHIRIGWELGLDFLPINVKDDSTLSGTATQFTYNYDTGGIIVPSAPYHGGPSGTGPLLSDTPSSTSSAPSTQQITGSRSLAMDLFAFRLGPSFFWDITPNLGLSFSGGPVIGCVTGNYEYDENININGVISHNKGSFNDTEFVYGAYLNTMLKYHIVDNGRNAYLFLGAQYTPMTSAHISNGERSADLNLSGQVYISAGLGWPF